MILRRGFPVLILFMFLSIIGATERFALVIGNSSYEKAPLKNTVNDAMDITDAFISMGYRVKTIIDGNREEIEGGVIDISNTLPEDSLVVFYYAGHAARLDQSNYIIPVREIINNENDLKYKGVNIDWITGALKASKSRTNIIILDSCRDNPFTSSFRGGSRGLIIVSAPKTTGPEIKNSAVIYATTDGSTAEDGEGRNSPFTKALLNNIKRENETILDVMTYVTQEVFTETEGRQEPTMTNALKEKIYFYDPVDRPVESTTENIPDIKEDRVLTEREIVENSLKTVKEEIVSLNKELDLYNKRVEVRNSQKDRAFKAKVLSLASYVGAGICFYYSYDYYNNGLENNSDTIGTGLLYAGSGAFVLGLFSSIHSTELNTSVERYDLERKMIKAQLEYKYKEQDKLEKKLEML